MIKTETWKSVNINKSNFVFSVVINNTVNNNYRGHGDTKHSENTQVLLQIYAPHIPHGQSWQGTQTSKEVPNYLTYGTAHPSTANGLTLIKSTTMNSTAVMLIYNG